MQNKKSLTQFSQQYQNIVQEVDQILQAKKSTLPPPEQLLSIDNNYCSSPIKVSFTGIKEFDKLLDGGFTKGSIVLLAGSSGSGKTIFSFQWLFEGIKNDENGIYVTLTEPLFKTLENLEKLSYYNKEAIENGKLRIVDLREVCGKEGFDQRKILDFIEDEVKRTNAKRLCIDSITAIAYQLDDRAKIRAFIFALGTALATLGCTTILTSEVSEMNKYSKYEVEEFISDAIIRFDQINVKDELQRIMRIIKVRGRNHRSDDIYFKITKDGISVFPKLRVPLEHFSTTERISMGIPALDDMLGGGIFVGSSTFITGSPGTGKSTLGLSFLAEGLKNGEACLYAGFEESKKQVLRNAKNFGWDFERYERDGLFVMRCIYPNEKHLEEHLADIRQIVEEKKIKRCVVDPLSAISSAFSPDAFISFSKRLNGYLKTREVTPLFTSASTSLIENTKDVDAHLSTLSDNIILLRYVEMQGDVQCVINIIKMRGSEHSKNLRMYNITDKGLVVGKSLEGYEGVTTGVSKKIAELEEESKELKEVIKQKELAEKVLRESEEKFRLLFNDSPLGIALVDPDGIIKEVNNSLLQLLSIRKEEFIGKNFVQLISVYGLNVQEQSSDFKNRITGKPSKREITFLSKDNKKVTITVQSSVIKNNDIIIGVLFILEDITERKRVEGMLSETNQYLENLFNYANAPIIVWDTQFAITRFNHAFESLTGRSVINVIGKPLEILFPLDKMESTMELIRKTQHGKQWEVVEIDVLHLDGSIRTVLWNSTNLFAPDGKTLIATIAQGQDITKRKKAQEELKESEEKFRDLFENANDLIQSADVNGRFIYVNKKWLRTLGYTEDDVKSLTITDILRKDQIPHCMEIINEVRNGKSFENVETVFMSKDGREIYVEGGANAKFKDGKFIATRGFFRDITDRKQAEEALGESEERFKTIFDGANDGILLADIGNKIFSTGNKAICRMLGYNLDEIKKLGVMEIHPKEDLPFVVEQFEKLARKEIALAENIPMKRKDGSIFYADISSTPITLTGKTYLVGLFRDITERKRAQEELKVANEKLNQIKSDFFEVTTREIRSPLTTIKGYMEMLSNRTFGEINDEQKKYLDIMLRNTNQLDNLVSDLVDISSIESGDMTFTLKKTSISKMVNEAVEKIQSSADVKNIAINVEIEDQIPDLIVDQDRIKQVLIDILGYTIKFSPDKTTVNMRAKKQETDVLFEIQDQGLNIPKDKQKKIFKAFYRAEEGKSKEYLGGGIRLALSRGIITIHGGKIWVESEDEKGSTFRFTLPIKPVDNIQTRSKESDIFESEKDDENIEIN